MSYNKTYNIFVDVTNKPMVNTMCDCHHDIYCHKCTGDGMCINCRDHIFPKWMKERCFTWWINNNHFINDDKAMWPKMIADMNAGKIKNIKKFDLIKVSKQIKEKSHIKKQQLLNEIKDCVTQIN